MGVLVGKWDLEQECESFPMMFMLQAAESVLIHSVRGQFGTELKVCKAEAGEFFLQERDKRIQKDTKGLLYMGVSKNRGTPKSSILIGFSIINHSFLGYPYFWETSI